MRSLLDLPRRFRLRRTPTGCAYALADDVSMLNPEHWDRLTARRSVFLSRRYLSLLHEHAPPGVRLHAALVYQEGHPVAAVAAQSLHVRHEEAGLSVQRLSAADVQAEAAALHRLYLNVQEKQRFRLVTLSPSYLPAMAAAFPEEFVTSGIRAADGRLAAFVTTLRDGEGAVGYFIGFDRELAATGVPLYLRLLQAVVEDAIALRARCISFGRTALEPKARLGAAMPQPDLPPERNPFREE